MLDIQDARLSNFFDAVITEAEQKKTRIMEEYQNRKKEETETEENRVLTWAYNYIQSNITGFSHDKNLAVSRHKNKLKRELIDARNAIMREVFESIAEKITEFTSSSEYPEYLKTNLDEAIKVIETDGTECIICQKDESVFKTLNLYGMTISISDDDFIGGFILKNLSHGHILDFSLKSKIENQKDYFLENSGLILN